MAMSIESELLDATHDYVTQKKNDLVAWKVYQIRKQNNFKRSTEKKKKEKKNIQIDILLRISSPTFC